MSDQMIEIKPGVVVRASSIEAIETTTDGKTSVVRCGSFNLYTEEKPDELIQRLGLEKVSAPTETETDKAVVEQPATTSSTTSDATSSDPAPARAIEDTATTDATTTSADAGDGTTTPATTDTAQAV